MKTYENWEVAWMLSKARIIQDNLRAYLGTQSMSNPPHVLHRALEEVVMLQRQLEKEMGEALENE